MKITALLLMLLPTIGLCAETPEMAVVQYEEAESNQNYVAALENVSPLSLRDFRTKFTIPDMGDTFKHSHFGQLSNNEIDALSDAEYFAKVFAGYFSPLDILGIKHKAEKVTVLGTVYDGDSKAYVVVKIIEIMDGKEYESVSMKHVSLEGGKWFVPIPIALRSVVDLFTKKK